jgi:hypothetical protein
MSEKETSTSKPKGAGIWILEGKKPKRIILVPGISDGRFTELTSGDIKEGSEAIVELIDSTKKSNPQLNPGFIR